MEFEYKNFIGLPDNEKGDGLDCGWGDFMPVRDALIGKTDADNYRHTIVRWAFMEEIWQDPKVEDLVDHWAKMTGLGELAIRLACSGERLADLVGLDYRAELLDQEEFTIEDENVEEFEVALAEFKAVFKAFLLRLETPNHALDVGREAKDFVLKLGLHYPWLAIQLIEWFWHDVVGLAIGLDFDLEWWYEQKLASEFTAPKINFTFQTREGEDVEEALERLNEQYQGAADKLLEPVPSTGKVPDRTIPALERDARWFYRRKVKRESIRSIAISEFGTSDRRKDIYDGISRAKGLLALTQYTY